MGRAEADVSTQARALAMAAWTATLQGQPETGRSMLDEAAAREQVARTLGSEDWADRRVAVNGDIAGLLVNAAFLPGRTAPLQLFHLQLETRRRRIDYLHRASIHLHKACAQTLVPPHQFAQCSFQRLHVVHAHQPLGQRVVVEVAA